MNKKVLQKLFIALLAIFCLTLVFFFFKDIMFDLIKYEKENNEAAINALLKDRGIMGMAIIVAIQALQMLVVFIPAEFIQVATGISFPWYISILILDLGVFIGASLIYILVNLLKFDHSMFNKATDKINNFVKRDKKQKRTIQSLMYLLFFLPIVPFGAVCYFGSSSKISYRRYILTCVTGVIPSILSSLLLGNLLAFFLSSGLSIGWLILIVIVGIILLFALTWTLVTKLYFKKAAGTPNYYYYRVLLFLFKLAVRSKATTSFDRKKLEGIDGPFILLSNHGSFFDVYFLSKLVYPHRMSFIMNRYYFKNKFFRHVFHKIGAIPKKLFSPDIETIRLTMKSIKDGFPVLMCPEGRLSVDGTNYYITKETGKLLKRLKVPVVIATINGAYLTNPKWRKKRIRGHVHTEVKHVITAQDIENHSVEELNEIINNNIAYNDFDYARKTNQVYKSKDKMLGAETILYHCPKCHKEYVLESNHNKLRCKECGFEVEVMDNYSFKGNELQIKDFSDYYRRIVKYEEEKINKHGVYLETDVKVKRYNFKNHEYEVPGTGKCILTKESFTFEGMVDKKEVKFTIPMVELRALAFSANEEFECYYDDELYYFYPTENKLQCVKWALIVDILNKEED